jgi:monoamine oxidase
VQNYGFGVFQNWLKCEQTGLAQAIFSESVTANNLSHLFSLPLAEIKDSDSIVRVICREDGQCFVGKTLISTIPLNVLSDVKFDPPLDPLKSTAGNEGDVDLAT